MDDKRFFRELVRIISIEKDSIRLSIPGHVVNGVHLNKSQIDESSWNLFLEGNVETGNRFYAQVHYSFDPRDIRIKQVEKCKPIILNRYSDSQLRKNRSALSNVYLVEEIIRLRNAINQHKENSDKSFNNERDLELWNSIEPKLECSDFISEMMDLA